MTNNKEGWQCPFCPLVCGRHWNLMVHIKRKHPDLSAGANAQQHNFGPDQAAAEAISIPQEQAGKFVYLANASNPDLMRWALMQSRLVRPASIENWINAFESNEDRYMKNPFMMLRDMKNYFAEKPGDDCFKYFVQLVKGYGRKSAQLFFKNLYFGEPQLHGQLDLQGQESKQYTNDSYGCTNPALPLDMAHNHPMAERFIRRYEEDKLEERMMKRKEPEKDGVHEAFEDYQRAMIISLMQNRSKEGNGAADPLVQISNLVAAGMMVSIPFIDANGNNAFRYELRNIAMAPTQSQNDNVHGGLGVADMLKIFETAYGKSNEFLMKYIEARGQDLNVQEKTL